MSDPFTIICYIRQHPVDPEMVEIYDREKRNMFAVVHEDFFHGILWAEESLDTKTFLKAEFKVIDITTTDEEAL